MASSDSKRTLKDIARAIELFPKILEQKKRAFKHKQKILKQFAPVTKKLAKAEAERIARTSHPLGADEIIKIASEHFLDLKQKPASNPLGSKYGNDFDDLIGGWTQYWNEILNPENPLDPNLVKALISTESDFKVSAKVLASKGNWARGLMQLTDETLKILKDEKGELKNFLVDLDQDDAQDPNQNIAAGIRWLFHKKALLEKRRKRTVSWEDAVMEYKAYTKDLKKKDKRALLQWNKFLKRLENLRK